MPILKNERLILVSAEEVTLQEKQMGELTGKTIKRWKYKFLRPDGTIKLGWDDLGIFKKDVKNVYAGYDDKLAKDFVWEIVEFQGVTKDKLYNDKLTK